MTPTARQIRFKARQSGLGVSECLPAPKGTPNALQTRCILPPARLPDPDLTHRALFPSAASPRLPESAPPALTLP